MATYLRKLIFILLKKEKKKKEKLHIVYFDERYYIRLKTNDLFYDTGKHVSIRIYILPLSLLFFFHSLSRSYCIFKASCTSYISAYFLFVSKISFSCRTNFIVDRTITTIYRDRNAYLKNLINTACRSNQFNLLDSFN